MSAYKNQSNHQIIISAAHQMHEVADNSVALVITSPPYPMIEMWDEIMSGQNGQIKEALDNKDGLLAFELMHVELDKVWAEVNRVLIPGGFACINIGDATRTIEGNFSLYPNHARIISSFQQLRIPNLPNIIWRKQTNAPNKFMGSGMLPSGAYVTLEHEWILIFRKGGKREFKTEAEKLNRKHSSFFWEERNTWFSDLWDLKGTKQKIVNTQSRKRSAAFPFEIPYRLINMYSLQDDIVLDPFLGTGTTTLAAMAAKRNSIGYEIDPAFRQIIWTQLESVSPELLNSYHRTRLELHEKFVMERKADSQKKELKHFNENLNTPVMTSQETNIAFSSIKEIQKISETEMIVTYSKIPPEFISDEDPKNKKKTTRSFINT